MNKFLEKLGFKSKQKDFLTVKKKVEVEKIEIPTIPLDKYPEIIRMGKDMLIKTAEKIARRQGKDLDDVLDTMDVTTFLNILPEAITVASKDFYALMGYVLEVEEEKVKKMTLHQAILVVRGIWEHNNFAEVQSELENFIRSLTNRLGVNFKMPEDRDKNN